MFKVVMKDNEGGEAQFPLSGILTVGRSEENDIILNDRKVSRKHAIFKLDGQRILIEDLGSSNGTYVNGNKISETHPLNPGDSISIGVNKLRLVETNPLMDFAAATMTGHKVMDETDKMEERKKRVINPTPVRPAVPSSVTAGDQQPQGPGRTFWVILCIATGAIGVLILYFMCK